MRSRAVLLSMALLLAMPAMAQISGDYVEFRTADVYTGPCFANAEVGLTGNEAVLAWRIRSGGWGDVPLDGLSVVAVVRASATIGDPYGNLLPAKTVFLVDERASEAQRAALESFAQSQASGLPATAGLLNDVVAVEPVPIRFAVDPSRHGSATLEAGQLARLATRSIGDTDKICHNEQVYYQPLASNLKHAMPAVATESSYRGNHLGVTWNESGRRSSFVATFSR